MKRLLGKIRCNYLGHEWGFKNFQPMYYDSHYNKVNDFEDAACYGTQITYQCKWCGKTKENSTYNFKEVQEI